MSEDDLIERAVRRLAAAIAGTSALVIRAEADVERERAEAALGEATRKRREGDLRGALREVDEALGRITHLDPDTPWRLDAGSLRALAPDGGTFVMSRLFGLRAELLRALGEGDPERAMRQAAALAEAPRSGR
ncbi:MAG: hypothetical protein U0234_23110 [Sandaracinus sp.]